MYLLSFQTLKVPLSLLPFLLTLLQREELLGLMKSSTFTLSTDPIWLNPLTRYQPPPWPTGRRKNISILFAQKFLSTIMSTEGRVGSQDNSITFLWWARHFHLLGPLLWVKRTGHIRDFQMVLMESNKWLLKTGWGLPKAVSAPLPLL